MMRKMIVRTKVLRSYTPCAGVRIAVVAVRSEYVSYVDRAMDVGVRIAVLAVGSEHVGRAMDVSELHEPRMMRNRVRRK